MPACVVDDDDDRVTAIGRPPLRGSWRSAEIISL
jgi:hypothetical protein